MAIDIVKLDCVFGGNYSPQRLLEIKAIDLALALMNPGPSPQPDPNQVRDERSWDGGFKGDGAAPARGSFAAAGEGHGPPERRSMSHDAWEAVPGEGGADEAHHAAEEEAASV